MMATRSLQFRSKATDSIPIHRAKVATVADGATQKTQQPLQRNAITTSSENQDSKKPVNAT